jgi:cellulase/cellobiase CelA1
MTLDPIQSDEQVATLYTLIMIKATTGQIPEIRILANTTHELQMRSELEQYVKEYLDAAAANYDAEEYEDLIDIMLGELIADNGTTDTYANMAGTVREWANNYSIKCYGTTFPIWLYLARRPVSEVAGFKESCPVPREDEDDED